MSERRILDDTPVVLRHVRRPQAGEGGGVTVLTGVFVAAGGSELDALNGRSGWQSGQVEAALSGDGLVSLRFPNAQGDDGILHRQRFTLLTDPTYRIGEEWIEVYREPMSPENLVAVMTPSGWKLDRGELELRGPDLMALYTLARSSELDVWHHAPRDVFDFYTRLPVAELAEAFPWDALPTSPATLSRDLPAGVATYAWEAAARLRWVSPAPPTAASQLHWLEVRLAGGLLIQFVYRPFDQVSYFQGTAIATVGGGGAAVVGKAIRSLPGDVSLKIVLRDRWLQAWVAGELVAVAQLDAAARGLSPDRVRVASEGTAVVQIARLDVASSRRFGLRGADKGSIRLPGSPTPGGLRGSWFNFVHHAAVYGTNPAGTWAQYLAAMMSPIDEPVTERLDPVPTFVAGGTPPAAGGGPSVRWTGSIYLDLSGNGRRLRLNTGASQVAGRVWIGRTERVADAVIDAWANGAKLVQTANLRDVLGEGSGWYPIVIEAATLSGIVFAIEESALDAGGVATGGWTAVPSSKFSPLGCYMETHRLESHRELLGAIAEAFGYQWRVDPRTLESGEFPGQVIPRIRVGVDTDKIVTAGEATDLASEGDAMDAVDRLLIDAAGIADPKGSGQLTADVLNDFAIDAGHLFLSSGAESLPEITEPELLQQRADSLLALRATPNEQIGVRPTSQPNEVTDTFPLTGALARRRWRVGDGLRLALEDLSVIDATPRQIAALALPIFRQGVGAPVVGWRQRPRGLRAFLKRTARAAAARARNPQGTFAVLRGTLGINPVATNVGDNFSRVTLPMNLEDVVEFTLVVDVFTGAAGNIAVNGTDTGLPVNVAGRYPLNRWIFQDPAAGALRRVFAKINTAGTYVVYLEVKVRL